MSAPKNLNFLLTYVRKQLAKFWKRKVIKVKRPQIDQDQEAFFDDDNALTFHNIYFTIVLKGLLEKKLEL